MLIPSSKWERITKQGFQEKHEPFSKAVEQGSEKGYDFNDFSQDLFSSLYQIDPKFPEQASAGTSWAKKALDELKGLPEFSQFRESGTKCDSFQSGLGASVLTKHFAEALPKVDKPNPDDLQKQIENIQSLIEERPQAAEKLGGALKQAQEALQGSQEAWEAAAEGMDPSQVRQVLRRAISDAQEQVSEAEQAIAAFGFGQETGQDGYVNDEQKQRVAEAIKNSPKLQKIMELAGRFRREAAKQQANKKHPGPDELTDIETGNDLGRLIPSELAKLGNKFTKLDFFKRYLERGLIQYKLEEFPHEAKGPIVVCIDDSSSMTGSPEIWSKAVALAMCGVATKNKRAFAIVHFNKTVQRTDLFEPGKVDPEALIQSCMFFSKGGTDFNAPLDKAFSMIDEAQSGNKAFKKADIILITDGDAEANVEKINENKKRVGAAIYSVCIGANVAILNQIGEVQTIQDIADDKEVKEKLFSL